MTYSTEMTVYRYSKQLYTVLRLYWNAMGAVIVLKVLSLKVIVGVNHHESLST